MFRNLKYFTFRNMYFFVFRNVDWPQDARTLTEHTDQVANVLAEYQETVVIDLADLDVLPSSVKMLMWHPLLTFLEQLPLPPTRRHGESLEDWRARAGADIADVRWVYEPRYTTTTGERVYTGDANSGNYFGKAWRVRVAVFRNVNSALFRN